MDVCPTPFLLFGHKAYNCDGTVIISASHNPPEFNGMKCLAPWGTFLSREELEEINQFFYEIEPKHFVQWKEVGTISKRTDIYDLYFNAMQPFINREIFDQARENPLKVVMDPGAGAGTKITSRLLSDFGMDVNEINTEKIEPYRYPREFEPIRANLTALSEAVVDSGAAVGFAHDCDADRLGLIGETGEIYSEDVILALLVNYLIKEELRKEPALQRVPVIVTNCASSLMLDDLAEQYNGKIFHTPVGERYLAEKMMLLMKDPEFENNFIFGGEGSCGGVMIPTFNNTRDGMFAAVKLCEMIIESKMKLSELVAELPKYYSIRRKINLDKTNALDLMQRLSESLQSEGIDYESIDNDIKVNGNKEWTLVHPSNTEPIIRIITEAPTEERANELLIAMDGHLARLRETEESN
jgi:phosphomannomutase/phosphoglucomutase